jgi:hypothetical protein
LTRYPLRTHFWLLVLALGALARPVPAQTPAGAVPVKTYTGYYNDTAVYFASFETNDFQFAVVNNLVYAPRLSQVNGSTAPAMIFFANAAYPQSVVLQTEPGQPDYSPLWQVVTATWIGTQPMPLITSFGAAQQWAAQGQLAMVPTGILFNGPVIRVNRSLNLQDTGSLAPTISPAEFLGIDPSIRTAYFQGHPGYYNDQVVTFLALEHAPGQISHAPGAIPVPTINASVLGTAGLAGFYAVDGQPPVVDSVPLSLASVTLGGITPGYTAPASSGAASTAPLYSPIWSVSHVSFNAGVTPQPLRSVAEIQQAASAGLVTVTPGSASDTFNCPIPAVYQPGIISPGATGTPTYVPPTATGGTTTGTTNTNPAVTPPATGGTTGIPY